MSAEIESLTDSKVRRPGGGGSPMLVALAALGLLLAAYAHFRLGRFDDRVERVRRQIVELRGSQDRIESRLQALTARLESSQTTLRSELRGLREVPSQVAELGQSVEELRTRTETPQRAWVRAEAMYLLDLGERRLHLERDVLTAIAAMESADARLATLDDPVLAEVRRLLGEEIAALRAVPVPDLPALLARIAAVERAVPALPVVGMPVAQGHRAEAPVEPGNAFERALRRLSQAVKDLISFRRVDPVDARLVTQQEESLRRQHLELLLFAARIGAMQADGAAYSAALDAASAWLVEFFDASSPQVTAARTEIEALATARVEPPIPAVGAAARQLQRVMRGTNATP
jgi:uroporphyrin-3 C-methyltransferase